MKRIFTFLAMIVLIFLSQNVKAQYEQYTQKPITPIAVSIHGGYSWLDGVVGVDFQSGLFGLSGGWMPTIMPMSGEPVNSIGVAASIYSGPPSDPFTMYISGGIASAGYQYEESTGYGETQPMTIVMLGTRYNGNKIYLKVGVGYGWCDYADAWTFEGTLGFPIFKNY